MQDCKQDDVTIRIYRLDIWKKLWRRFHWDSESPVVKASRSWEGGNNKISNHRKNGYYSRNITLWTLSETHVRAQTRHIVHWDSRQLSQQSLLCFYDQNSKVFARRHRDSTPPSPGLGATVRRFALARWWTRTLPTCTFKRHLITISIFLLCTSNVLWEKGKDAFPGWFLISRLQSSYCIVSCSLWPDYRH